MPTTADLAAFARRRADDARRTAANREEAAHAWEIGKTAPSLDRQEREARAGVERRMAQHHQHAAEMFDAMAAALEKGTQ